MRLYRFLPLLVFLCCLLVPPVYAGAPDNCVALKGVAQEHLLDFSDPMYIGRFDPERGPDPWVGPVVFLLSTGEVLQGKISEYDGDATPPPFGVGQGKGGSYLFDFFDQGSFIVKYDNAVWPNLRQFASYNEAGELKTGTGTFHANGTVDVTAGTGRFSNTTGNIMTDGPFIAWNLDVKPPNLPSGRFSNSISGTLCNIAQKD